MVSEKSLGLLSAAKLLILVAAVFCVCGIPVSAQYDCSNVAAADFGLLVNFSVPCDLPTEIAVPDAGGLLTPNLLGVGYQEYRYTGSQWVYVNQMAALYNKTLNRVGSVTGSADGNSSSVEFQVEPLTLLTANPSVEVSQMFSIPLQLLTVTSTQDTSGTYGPADYIQRFGTIMGLPPTSDYPAQAGDTFKSKFSAFYAFYLPFNLSPQLATRVPRCGDERFYGIQAGRTPIPEPPASAPTPA
ncbi:hypothetical protein R1flu_018042 [Riccia fluitans]|uniref:Uncharacterized protein n=1 Tax=Riccia fluitans TaxID=41844 RepID=A0ABD1ZI39_9MARC